MDDFANLKLPELRKECKARGLSTAGNKPDLVSRLQVAISTEKLPSDDSVLDDALIDEDSMLGEDDDSSPDDNDLADLTSGAIDLCSPTSKVAPINLSPSKSTGSPAKKGEAAIKRPLSGSPLKAGSQTNGAGVKAEEGSPPAKKKITINRESVQAPSSLTEIVKETDDTSEEGEKKVIKIETVALSAEEKAKLRAQKFGISEAASTSTPLVVAKDAAVAATPIVDEKLKKRMERFNNGTTTTTATTTTTPSNNVVSLTTEDDIKLAKRKERFGIQKEEVKKETRAARFGATASSNTTTDETTATAPSSATTPAVAATTDSSDKKQLRAARFAT